MTQNLKLEKREGNKKGQKNVYYLSISKSQLSTTDLK